MALPYWKVKRIKLRIVEPGGTLPPKRAFLAKCPRCKGWVILAINWRKRNTYGTAPCPNCFKTSRIPRKEHIEG